jgi:hypothetical protein
VENITAIKKKILAEISQIFPAEKLLLISMLNAIGGQAKQ